jgi:hypothetical protein
MPASGWLPVSAPETGAVGRQKRPTSPTVTFSQCVISQRRKTARVPAVRSGQDGLDADRLMHADQVALREIDRIRMTGCDTASLPTGCRRSRAGRERHVCRAGLRRCGVVLEVWREMLSSGCRGVPGTALVCLRVRCRYCSDEPEGEPT